MTQTRLAAFLLKPRWYTDDGGRASWSPCQWKAKVIGGTWSLSYLGWINGLFSRFGFVLILEENKPPQLVRTWF